MDALRAAPSMLGVCAAFLPAESAAFLPAAHRPPRPGRRLACSPFTTGGNILSGNFHFESLREGSHQRQRFAKAQRKPALSPRGLCTGPFTFALTPKHRNWPFFHGVLGHLSLSLLSSPKSAALCVGTYPAGNGSAVIFRSMLVNNRRVRWLSAKSSQ